MTDDDDAAFRSSDPSHGQMLVTLTRVHLTSQALYRHIVYYILYTITYIYIYIYIYLCIYNIVEMYIFIAWLSSRQTRVSNDGSSILSNYDTLARFAPSRPKTIGRWDETRDIYSQRLYRCINRSYPLSLSLFLSLSLSLSRSASTWLTGGPHRNIFSFNLLGDDYFYSPLERDFFLIFFCTITPRFFVAYSSSVVEFTRMTFSAEVSFLCAVV